MIPALESANMSCSSIRARRWKHVCNREESDSARDSGGLEAPMIPESMLFIGVLDVERTRGRDEDDGPRPLAEQTPRSGSR
jgi:hypothetical protein